MRYPPGSGLWCDEDDQSREVGRQGFGASAVVGAAQHRSSGLDGRDDAVAVADALPHHPITAHRMADVAPREAMVDGTPAVLHGEVGAVTHDHDPLLGLGECAGLLGDRV